MKYFGIKGEGGLKTKNSQSESGIYTHTKLNIAAPSLKSAVSHGCDRYGIMYLQSQYWKNISL